MYIYIFEIIYVYCCFPCVFFDLSTMKPLWRNMTHTRSLHSLRNLDWLMPASRRTSLRCFTRISLFSICVWPARRFGIMANVSESSRCFSSLSIVLSQFSSCWEVSPFAHRNCDRMIRIPGMVVLSIGMLSPVSDWFTFPLYESRRLTSGHYHYNITILLFH